MDWNKDHIRETMLLLETAALHSARENYLDYVSTARLDRSEPIENDELAQAEVASDFAEALDRHDAGARPDHRQDHDRRHGRKRRDDADIAVRQRRHQQRHAQSYTEER